MEDVILDVPFAEKDEAKALGAKWNPAIKKWYVPKGSDTSKCRRWFPDSVCDPEISIKAPLYLLQSSTPCWRCNEKAVVFCLASEGLIDKYEDEMELDMFVTYHNLVEVPEQISTILKSQAATYYPDYTKQSNSTYYVNHCHCGAKLGDFYLHEEPGGAFCPVEKRQAEQVNVIELDGVNETQISAGYGVQDLELISVYGKRQKPSFLSRHLNQLNIFFK